MIPAWLDVEVAWEKAKGDLDELLKLLRAVRSSIQGVDGINPRTRMMFWAAWRARPRH